MVVIACFLAFVLPSAAHAATLGGAGITQPVNNLGLKIYWPLEEGSGAATADRATSNALGTLTGTATWSAGKIGRGVSLDGSSGYIIGTNSVSLTSATTSVSVWVKFNSVSTNFPRVIDIQDGTYSAQIVWDKGGGGSNQWATKHSQFQTGVSATQWGAGPTQGVWYHVVAVWDSVNNTTSFYVNGVPLTGSANSNVGEGANRNKLIAGVRGDLNAVTFASAVVDDIRIYNRALSAAEVKALYKNQSARVGSATAGGVMNGLIGYWPLDGATTNWTTNLTRDVSGLGNDGRMTSLATSSTPVQGKIGYAMRFTGNATSYINLGSHSVSQIASAPISISAWVNPNNDTDYRRIISREVHFFFGTQNRELIFGIGSGGGWNSLATFGADATLTNGQWYHVAVVYNGTMARGYVNGVDVGTVSASLGSNSNNLLIGSHGGTQAWNGIIDEVRMYNRVLSPEEVRFLASQRVPTIGSSAAAGQTSGLVGHWTMDGSRINWSTGQMTDASGQGRTVQLLNFSTTTSPTQGKVGQALKFNGSNQNLTTGLALSNFCSASDCTMSVWLKPAGTAPLGSTAYSGAAAIGDSGGYIGIYRANISGTDNLWAYNWNGTEQRIGVSYNTNVWTHIVLVHTGGVLYVYKNGQLGGSTASSDTQVITGTLTVGRGYSPSPFWSGSLDDVRVYNRALSAAEVKALYNATK